MEIQLSGQSISSSQSDLAGLDKLLSSGLKLPVRIESMDGKQLTLEINQQQIKIPVEQLDSKIVAQLKQLSSQQNTQLYAELSRTSGKLVINLLTRQEATQQIEQPITRQQLLQLLPNPSTHPQLSKSQLVQANTLVELLTKVSRPGNANSPLTLSIGSTQLATTAKLQTQLTSMVGESLRTQLKQAGNNIFLQLHQAKSNQVAIIPVTDKKTLFQLAQYSVANGKTLQLNAELKASNKAMMPSQAGQQPSGNFSKVSPSVSGQLVSLNQMQLTQKPNGVINQLTQPVSVAGRGEFINIKTQLPVQPQFIPQAQLRLSGDATAQLIKPLLQAAQQQTGAANSSIESSTVMQLSAKEQQIVDKALRQLVPLQQNPSAVIKLLQATATAGQTELRPLLQSMANLLTKQVAQPQNLPNSEQLQQQIQTAVNPTPVQLQPPAQPASTLQQGMEGLIQLLLTAKASARSEATLSDPLQQKLINFIAAPIINKRSLGPLLKQLGNNNLSQQLLSQLSGVLASQRLTQLGFVESLQQNNPQYFLTVPVSYDSQTKDLEILIRPDQQNEQDEQQQKNNKASWQINLRFDIPKLGVVMTTAQLTGSKLQLDFYTESLTAKTTIDKFSGTLEQRLSSAGLEVKQLSCQQGKIPKTLQQKHHSLLYVRA